MARGPALHLPYAKGKAQPMPRCIAPMLAVLSDLPSDAQKYGFEYKWDGVRAVCFWDGRTLRLCSRNQLEIGPRYPELHALGEALGRRRVILDGEIVALDEADRPSFERLQRRMHADPRNAPRLMRDVPVDYFLFDVLYLDDRSTMPLPWTRRRELLEELALAGEAWRISPAHVGAGGAMLQTARRHSLEGIIAKRLDSIYEPGRRSPAWRKIKIVQRQEFVVGGWTEEKGNDELLGAMLLGYYEGRGTNRKLRYAGRVGTGYDARTQRALLDLLKQHPRDDNPFDDSIPRSGVHFVEPRVVVDVEYRRWPAGGMIQQASLKGVRTDKNPTEIIKEERSDV